MKTFLDAGVLIALVRGNTRDREAALTLLSEPSRVFVASLFLRLELLPKPFYHRREQELAILDRYFNALALIEPDNHDLVARSALTIAREHGLGACDALHVAAARVCGCEDLITTELPKSPLFRVSWPRIVPL